ncbi:MAG: PKD domain-containing protein, partial [Bacteroidota bacterium]|nr:PKD domain-containing protein [Bacteroidota bacterium]
SATATVTVQDNIAPGLTVPANIVQLNDAGVCGAVVNIGLATATDNCTVASVTSDAPAFFPVGITTVTWTALDVNANSTTGTQTVEITNNAPVISGLNVSALVQLGDATLASATHADNNLVGATWNWGDGSSTPALITGTNLSGNHVYGQTGLYDVTLTIEDACGKTDTETFSYVVIYNSCDGFITGGGYINTPAGAYAAKPTSTDKSEYEFEAKYHKGALAPKGEFKFKMHSGNFEVKSTSLDWLMVNNDQAILKGSASVNGQGGYQFIVSVLDGDITSKNGTDYLRLIVWDNTGNVLYDNQNGDPDKASASNPISKGQVVIHKPKNGNCFSDDEDENDKSSANSSDNSSDKNKSGNLEVVLTPVQMDMTVYPNPVVSAEVTISIEGFGNTVARIDLANLSGQQVYTIQSVKFQGGKAKTEFKQANLKSGNYLLRVTEINTSRFGVKQIIVSSKK